RSGLHGPLGPYLARHLHVPPSTRWLDPTGEAALEALDRALQQAGPENVAAFFCEAISAAALPAHTPPRRFWEGLDERLRERGVRLREELEDALSGIDLAREVRGHGFLLGVSYVDPRDPDSFLPPELRVAGRIDHISLEGGLVVLSTQPTRDGMAGD